MPIHESGVNYENLIRDLAEMYPFEVAEVVFTELIANSLDAKPTIISIDFNGTERILVVSDNGCGMSAEDFDQYHDFAAGLKTRGKGIGFAGVGAKVSFNIATRVITETRSASYSGGSNWYLQSKKKLVWEDIQPQYLKGTGTRVEVVFSPNVVLPYSSRNAIVKLLQRHYLPLLDKEFLDLYERLGYYSSNIRFIVNGNVVQPMDFASYYAMEQVEKFIPKKASSGIGYGVFGLAQSEYPVEQDLCGVLLCTHGKVIKADLFNQFPGVLGPRILGLVEIPEFIGFLTTAKTDFIRRKRLRDFESLYNPVRQQFKQWLSDVGIESTATVETDEAIRLERELKKILDDIPELSEFFGFRTRKTVLKQCEKGEIDASVHDGMESTFPIGEGIAGEEPGPVDIGDEPGQAFMKNGESGTQKSRPISRVARRGPKITFSNMPECDDLAWIDGNNVVINSGHPSYTKISHSPTASRLHSLFALGNAIQRFIKAEGISDDITFVDRMMTAWGKK